MGQTQSIIVYRNPLEQQMWESGYVVLFLMLGLVFVAMFYGLFRLAAWFAGGEWYVNTNSWIMWVIAAGAGILTWAVFHFVLPFIALL